MEERIRETFYNEMFDKATEFNWVTYDRLRTSARTCKGLIVLTMIEIIKTSRGFPDKIILFDKTHLMAGNCPDEFKELFGALVQLKKVLDVCSEEDYLSIKTLCMSKLQIVNVSTSFNSYVTASSQRLVEFANIIYDKQVFHIILKRIAELFQSMKTHKVSEELIRDTFYNMMVNEGLETSAYVSKDDLENAEAFIFLDLSAFTIIAACVASKGMDGIGLMDGSALNMSNCPENYKELATIILHVKQKVSELNLAQINDLKKICSSNPNIECDDKIKTSALTSVAVIVNQIATKISQRNTFKNIIIDVINFCIEIQ